MLVLRLDVDGQTVYSESRASAAIESVVLSIGNGKQPINSVVIVDLLEEIASLKEKKDFLETENEDLKIIIDRASRMLDC